MHGGYVAKRVFLSYAAEDRDYAQRLVSGLEKAGIDVWWDQHIPGGARYETEIERALNDSELVIVAWSEAANQSDWVKDEAEFARNVGKLYPISFDGSLAPIGFRQYQVAPCPNSDDRSEYADLADAIKHRLDNPMSQPSGTGSLTTAKRKTRIPIWAWLAGITVIAAGLWFGLFGINKSQKPDIPLVMIMDSAHPARIYDQEVQENGGTNADILSDILSDLPIQTQKELISPAWQRNEAILRFEPDLIVIHYSGFKQEDSKGDRPQLRLLIQYFAETQTEFLVYSRAGNEWLQGNMDIVLEDVYAEHPSLRERVYIYPLLEYGDPHWKDPATSQGIKLKVKSLLELETG